jgi:arylsulfatase A-like enzyme
MRLQAVSSTGFVQWGQAIGTQDRIWGRAYVYLEKLPSTKLTFFRVLNGSGKALSLGITPVGQIKIFDATNQLVRTSTSRVAIGSYNRIEFFVDPATTTTGQAEVRLFTTADSTTATETLVASNKNFNTQTTTYRFGQTDGSKSDPSWFDDLLINTTGWPGPATSPPPPQCSDALDNDSDGKIDYPLDPGCTDAQDNDETDISPPPTPQCSDGIDNDGDGQVDFPLDAGCTDTLDNNEIDPPGGETPNVLIIMTDDQRASSDGLSVMDDTLKIFGDGGTYYPNAVVTTPLCCPSRASIFSGRYAHNTGVLTNSSADKFDPTTSMQYHLQRLGYKTALVGKYLNEVKSDFPYFDLQAWRVGYYDSSGSYSTTYIKDKAVEFLNTFEQNDAQPWLMYVHPYAPHPDATPETKYENAYVPPWDDNPARTETDLSDKPPYVAKQAANVSKTGTQNLRSRMIRTLYSVDDLVASVFAQLDALEETNTVAFFLSDNGYQWYEHQLDGKGHVYDDSVQVPFFIRWPGRVPASLIDTKVVANIDIAPTVYDILGYTPDNYTVDGRSLFTSNRSFVLTEGFGRGFHSLWSPDSVYSEYGDGFKEYYWPDDPWQLDNGFKTGRPPPSESALHDQLLAYKNCVGSACP